jgi:D-alanyl-D-alanine carboxypeptidase/D-alanyl-D-alanine-endopeptidase (penicillin-binding protein 4)
MLFRRALVVLAAVLGLVLPASADATTGAQLSASLSKSAPGLGPSSGVLVKKINTNQELFSLRADTKLVPASNEKLFTTSAALLRYGPAATLPTTVRVRTGVLIDPATGILPGDVFLVGGGDPTLNDAGLTRLAVQLHKAGVKQISGGVRADESFLDKRRGSFDSRFKVDSDLAGQLSGLSYDHGRSGSAKLAGTRLQSMLRAQGITLGAQAKTGHLNELGREIASIASPNLAALTAMTNIPSENFYAEMLVKDLGGSFGSAGSTPAGVAVVRSTMSNSIGIKPRIVDGSGLSRQDRTTARQLVNLLDKVDETPEIAAPFSDSLPRFGREGTLKKRLRGSAASKRCAAKTGTLIGVSSLSGYCTTPAGATIAFSILSNRVNAGVVKHSEDKLVKAIAAYTG